MFRIIMTLPMMGPDAAACQALALDVLFSRHHWPGNIRELENVIAHGCMVAEGSYIDIDDLPEYCGTESGKLRAIRS